MFLLKQILPATIIAMMVAAGVCGLALFCGNERVRRALATASVGLAYLAGHLVITGWGSFPPADSTNWLPYFAVITAALGAAWELLPTKPWARLLIFAVVCAGMLRLLLKPKFQYGWSPGEGWLWVAGAVGAFLLLTAILDALARRSATTAELPALLLIVSAGTFGGLMLSGSMLLAQFASILGAALLGTMAFAIRRVDLGQGIAPVFSLLLVLLLLSGYFFAELPPTSALLLAFSPGLALVPLRMPVLSAFLVRGALVAVPVLIALFLAFRSSPPLDY
jgi:hypothetical protein